MNNKSNKAEKEALKAIEEELARQEADKERRLDILVDMQQDLAQTKIRYYILFTIGLIVVLVIIGSLFTLSFFEGLVIFVAGFWGLRYILVNKILVRKYNAHVDKMYNKKGN